uniref:Aldehyde dehydrogenase n=1 Tax=Tetraodon nigroviridis TaxID=99883 RepID=H3D914_TETNG
MDTQSQVVERLRSSFGSGVTIPEPFRQAQLKRLMAMIKENEQLIINALHKDLAKPKFEVALAEIDGTVNELHHAIVNLSSWMKPEYVSKNLATKLDECFVRREPLGVVLIIGAWNYPLQLILNPLIGAIAAGNCAVLKPSEVAPATESLVAELIPKYLSQDCYAVVQGGAEETQALLKNRFDHIFYTGSQKVARVILQAASVHLTPVTLELGGKCPCLIFGRVDIKVAVRRLVWAKFFNAGQSCVAPDYVLCLPATRDAILTVLKETLEEFYTEDPQGSPDFCRIVSPRHWSRLMDLLKRSNGKVVVGGESDQEDKYIAPTVVVDVAEDDALMQEEIFGPILPILTVDSVAQGIEFLNGKDKPALYVFSDDSSIVNTVLERTSSGGFCSNDGIIHPTLPSFPFGGVGASGSGSYHGRWGFETFSHRKACMLRGWALERLNGLRYPPYNEEKLSMLRWTTSPKNGCSVM